MRLFSRLKLRCPWFHWIWHGFRAAAISIFDWKLWILTTTNYKSTNSDESKFKIVVQWQRPVNNRADEWSDFFWQAHIGPEIPFKKVRTTVHAENECGALRACGLVVDAMAFQLNLLIFQLFRRLLREFGIFEKRLTKRLSKMTFLGDIQHFEWFFSGILRRYVTLNLSARFSR